MFTILSWMVFGLFVGLIAKAIHPGSDPTGFFPTIGIGIAGSFLGGFISWVVGGGELFAPSGIVMSIVGGVLFCYLYRQYVGSLGKNEDRSQK